MGTGKRNPKTIVLTGKVVPLTAATYCISVAALCNAFVTVWEQFNLLHTESSRSAQFVSKYDGPRHKQLI